MPAHFDYAQCKQNKGFTLVELLVIIFIIAILSVVGLVIFTNAQKSVRDAKRRGDMDAITKALEIHYRDGLCPPNNYCPPAPSYFSSNTVPKDLLTPSTVCVSTTCGGSYIYVDVAGLGYPLWPNDGSFAPLGAPGGRSANVYKICADLESDGVWDGTHQDYCVSNQQ